MKYAMGSLYSQRGAALLSVLVVSVILSLLLAGASELMQRRLSLAELSTEQLKEKSLATAKMNELIYLASTQRITRAGISQGTNAQALSKIDGQWSAYLTGDEIRVDGFQYHAPVGNTSLYYSIQAENGLVPVNTSNQYWLRRWLTASGADVAEVSILADRLADYADADDWSRAAGAESRQYLRDGRLPPPNYLLQSCDELHQVMGWEEILEQHPDLPDECSLLRSSDINLNAIPVSLWRKLWPDSADKIQRMRENGQWLITYGDAIGVAPSISGLPEPYFSLIAYRGFYITVSTETTTATVKLIVQEGELLPYKRYSY